MTTKPKKEDVPSAEGTISTRVEQKQVEERLAIGAHVVYETIRREGEEELRRTAAALAWSALAAGLSLGFSFIAEALLMAHLPDTPWRPLISRVGYCVGFLIVILGRQQLFTENTLTVILPLLLRKDLTTLLRVLRLWAAFCVRISRGLSCLRCVWPEPHCSTRTRKHVSRKLDMLTSARISLP